MKVADILRKRQKDWKDLEDLIRTIQNTRAKKLRPEVALRFARLYRTVCGDLALARAWRFPEPTVRYLHQLVGEAHNALYRSRSFDLSSWGRRLFVDVPLRMLRDPAVLIATVLFWGLFFGSMAAAIILPDFAAQTVGESALSDMENMYSQDMSLQAGGDFVGSRTMMAGFYVYNNAGIGLQCFASGIFFGIGSLFTLSFNAVFLGAIFGHMATTPHSANFLTFVTAHGPFELTAVSLSAGAGLRLGWGLVDTGGLARWESLRRQAGRSLEIAAASTVLFLLAAWIEAYVSPAPIDYLFKLGVAVVSSLLLLAWVAGPSMHERRAGRGTRREDSRAT
jgi:uncharacterized membrane protein SpoIIM required for sporulation